ncbi:hypothetical protein CYMTET_43669, partial [Cymbomonas tetramitiformis]
GFSIFYCGINAGAALAPLVAGALRARFGFHVAFMMAAFGMLLAPVVYTVAHRMHQLQPTSPDYIVVDGAKSKAHQPPDAESALNGSVDSLRGTIGGCNGERALRACEGCGSINPLLVIGFTPLIALLWQYLGKHWMKEGAGVSLIKMTIGPLLLGAGYLVLAMACSTESGDEKINPSTLACGVCGCLNSWRALPLSRWPFLCHSDRAEQFDRRHDGLVAFSILLWELSSGIYQQFL